MTPSSSGEKVEPTGEEACQNKLPELFESFRTRLHTLVEVRIDRRIRARVDASDIVQEAFVDAVRRFPEFQRDRKMSPYLWLRFLTMQQLTLAHRRHLGVKARAAGREQSIEAMQQAGVDSGVMAFCLAGNDSTPSAQVSRAEGIQNLTVALDAMEPLDREVLALRHFEQLKNVEIAQVLDMTESGVSQRYRRALKKIGQALKGYDGKD